MSFKEYLGIESPLVPRAAAGLPGFGLKGSLCGVYLASLLAIGMKHGRNDPKDTAALVKTNGLVQKFTARYVKEFGSRDCWELAGRKIDTPEGFKAWAENGGVKRCNAMIQRTAKIMVEEYLI